MRFFEAHREISLYRRSLLAWGTVPGRVSDTQEATTTINSWHQQATPLPDSSKTPRNTPCAGEHLTAFLAFLSMLRHVVYTTNAIEPMNYQRVTSLRNAATSPTRKEP